MSKQPQLRVLVNSIPKSGTHLLGRCVSLIGYQRIPTKRTPWQLLAPVPMTLSAGLVRVNWQFVGQRLLRPNGQPTIPIGVSLPIEVPLSLVNRWLAKVPNGRSKLGHIPWTAHAAQLLQQLNYKHVLIIRDPRAVLVSFLHFIQQRRHPLYRDFQQLTSEAQIKLVVTGGQTPLSQRPLQGLAHWYHAILGWKQTPDTLFIRFEDLIGQAGGGGQATQYQTIHKLCAYLSAPTDNEFIDKIQTQLFNPDSPTFRKGQIDTWRQELSISQQQLINKHLSDTLTTLAYDV